jgi:hypothetical protein
MKTNAEKYSSGSFRSDIRFTAAPPNPPSPIRLKIPKYARNRKYAPRGAGPRVCAKYIVERKPTIVRLIVEATKMTLCRWIELIFMRREMKRESKSTY